ncbi:glycosyltransferase [Bianquea renquensis]|jgi:glycosyltransferase, family 1|uniref:Glycosyltransferase n=1 Tax=Bianquea renquensis TaxID=2763661 RepID=A0A926DUJ8_9FIRM|nr:glycosyltransferase [Bianquea renquensis]MBC8544966.1 glycosyltransferase [Bianquea renquensis]
MRKHILILTTTNEFLGKFERENVKILQSMGFAVHYASNMREPHYISDEARIQQMGVQTHHIDIARSPFMVQDNLKALRQLVWLIRTCHIQVIHCHTPVGGLLGRLAGLLFRSWKLMVMYTAHGFHFYKGAPLLNTLVYYRVEKWMARFTDVLIVINEEDYINARRFRLKKGGHVYKIPGTGLDRDVFKPVTKEKRNLCRERLGIREDEFFLVSIGELNENKNHRVVLEALTKLKQRNQNHFNIRYGICGDGFFRQRLERWIQEMGLGDCVTLYGYCLKVPEILGAADATLFPSKREGLGMAGLESLAMGIPVIAADNRGTREYMEHGKNGYVFPCDDVEGFVEGIERIQNLSAEKKMKMKFHCQNSVKAFDKVYANAVMRRIYSDVDHRLERRAHEK